MVKSNFHTHSTFCDGKDNIESIVEYAIEKGLKYLGFSSHSHIEGDLGSLGNDRFFSYISEILRVKEKYKTQIEILVGIEQDLLSSCYDYNFDYIIGSMHYIEKNKKAYPIDYSIDTFKYLLQEVYQNDFDALCKDYYNQIKQIASKTKATVIGHFDLVTKFIDKLNIPLPENYYKYAEESVKEVIKAVKLFEINTGVIARGYKNEPYPSKQILKMIYENGGEIIINSDCHKKEHIDYAFDRAVEIAKEVGFKTHAVITSNGIKYFEL